MCQRAGQERQAHSVVDAASISGRGGHVPPASAPAVTETAVVRRAADALPYCVLSDPASLLGCRENACRSPVPPGDQAGSLG
jgi:hypothetical protein